MSEPMSSEGNTPLDGSSREVSQERSSIKRRKFDMKKKFPITNAILTLMLLGLVPWLFILVLRENSQRTMFAILLLVGVVAILACEFLGEKVGAYISIGPLKGEPWNNPLKVGPKAMKRSKQMVKFKSQSWQLACHVIMALLEYRVLTQTSSPTSGLTFLEDPARMSLKLEPNVPLLETVYLLQLAIWVITGIFHVFILEQQSDYLVMLGHHVVTVGVLGLSFQHNFVRFGVCVLYVHDISDIVIDLLKLSNYLNLSNVASLFLVEIVFASNFITWAYYRLWVLPYYIIYEGAYKGWQCAIAIRDAGGDVAKSTASCIQFLKHEEIAEQAIQDARNRGDEPPYSSIAMSGGVAILLLCVLVCMHVWWYVLFISLAKRIMTNGGDAKDAGAEEYEGDDDTTEDTKQA